MSLSAMLEMASKRDNWTDKRTAESVAEDLMTSIAERRPQSGKHDSSSALIKLVREYAKNEDFATRVDSLADAILTLFPVEKEEN